MPSITRPLTGPNLTFNLAEHQAELRQDEGYRRSGRAGRTLARSGPLRLTLVAMAKDNVIGTHQADSPMTLQVVTGHIQFRANDGEHQLGQGEVLFFGPGDAHDIRATEETLLLITIGAQGDDHRLEQPSPTA